MKKISILLLLALSTGIFANGVSVEWGANSTGSNMFFSNNGDLVINNTQKTNTSLEKNISKEAENVQYQHNTLVKKSVNKAVNSNMLVSLFGGCIPHKDESVEWDCVDDFKISAYEVSNAEYRKFDSQHNSGKGFNGDNQPVVNISKGAIKSYIAWLNEETGLNYRLPTSNELLYAALAGLSTPNTSCEVANMQGCNNRTTPVGYYNANNWGLYDMFGNVLELTSDGVLGGGSWSGNSNIYQGAANNLGFRLVMSSNQ
jgi:hypothetical protein